MCPKANLYPHRLTLFPCPCLSDDQARDRIAEYFQSDSYDFIPRPQRLLISLASNHTYWDYQRGTGVQLIANGQKASGLEENQQLVNQFEQG